MTLKYLLSLKEFPEGEKGQALLERAFSGADQGRRERAARMKTDGAKAACLGAGLLLRLAAGEAEGKMSDEKTSSWKQYSASALLDRLEEGNFPAPALRYGEKGKPYFRDLPFYFNLSHSGEYVVCALSHREMGADIQVHQCRDRMRLARRFFTGEETAALEKAHWQEDFFFRLWARKEAYGKLTGEGLAGALDISLVPGSFREGPRGEKRLSFIRGREISWEEPDLLPGYSIALCRYETEPQNSNI